MSSSPAGIALNSTQFSLSRILGPAVAGVLMSSVGAAGAFAVSAASYLPFILIALWILPRGATAQPEGQAFDFRQVRAGVREVVHEPLMRGAILTVLVTSLLTAPLITFAPVLVRDGFQGAVSHFSLAVGAFGAGGLLGAVALLAIDPKQDRRPLGSWLAVAYAVHRRARGARSLVLGAARSVRARRSLDDGEQRFGQHVAAGGCAAEPAGPGDQRVHVGHCAGESPWAA
ncbi:MAG: MFS transporter [Gammaproteobacteria bacterium]